MSTQKLPILLSIPHAGLDIPPEVTTRLAIDATTIYNECDLWAEQLFDFAGRALAGVTMPIARVLVDANRPPGDWQNFDGAIKTRTSYGEDVYRPPLTQAEREQLQNRYWQPFQSQLDQAIADHGAEVKLLIDCHNMAQRGPAAYHDPGKPRPFICLGTFGDAAGNPAAGKSAPTLSPALARAAAEAARTIFGDLELLEPDASPAPIVALNRPFAGGYILRRATDALARVKGVAVPAVMVEVNRGLFVGNQTTRTPIAPPNQERIRTINERIVRWTEQLLEMIDYGS
jgi:N-formylglutamate amidohydrolase